MSAEPVKSPIWTPKVHGFDPFYRARMAELMFDQSALAGEKKTLPLRPFQRTILAASTMYQFIDIYAPSQSGKTTAVEVLVATLLYEYPGISVLVLSTKDEQSERIIRGVRNQYIKCHKVEELRELDPKGGDAADKLILKQSQSTVIAVPHAMRAVTGNPARVVILDEMAYWDKEDPRALYAQAVARTGNFPGFIIVTISTFNGASRIDNEHPDGFVGNFFHHKWSTTFQNRHKRDKSSIAFRFTYHVSENLVKNIDIFRKEAVEKGTMDNFNEHYMGIPRKMPGKLVFEHFSRDQHVKPDPMVVQMLNPDEPLFLALDPGFTGQGAVLGQVDPRHPRILILRSYLAQKKDFPQFLDYVLLKVRREFPGWHLMPFIDIQAKQVNDQTAISNADIVYRKMQDYPVMNKYQVEPGIKVMRSYMRLIGGFLCSDHKDNQIFAEAMENAVAQERNGVFILKYKKDGYYEHIIDPPRYAIHFLTSGQQVDTTPVGHGDQGYIVAISPY